MKSIRAKLLLPFLVGLLIVTILLSLYTYNAAKEAVMGAAITVSKAKTDQIKTSMNLLFTSILSTAQNIIVDPHIAAIFSDDGDSPGVARNTDEWMEILVQGNDYYREIYITDNHGICICSSNPGLLGKTFAENASVQKALGGMFSLEDFSVGLITKKLSATVSGPVDVQGEVVGALVIICDFPQIVTYRDSETAEENVLPALLTPEGLFAAHTERSIMGNEEALFPDLYEKFKKLGQEGDQVEYTLQGKSYVGYARLEPISRWVVLTGGLKHKVLTPAYRVGLTVFGISFFGLCVISLLVIRFANGILDSLLSLIGYAKRVSEGDFDTPLRIPPRDDELGILQSSLQKLVETLRSMLFQTQEVSRMKGEFLANMSHEIRTPINAIIGMSHLSLRDSEIPPKQRDYLEKIQTAAKSLLGVINDILDISKIEAGKLTLENTTFDLRKLLEDTFSIHQISASSKSVTLSLDCAPNVPRFLIGDPLRIGQILHNLIANALKFTEKGGIHVTCQALDENDDDALIRIEVSDTGIGMSLDTIENLFKPFTQADASISRKFGGTGLGLAICRSLLEMMGGELSAESVLGKGSTFTVTLRLAIDCTRSEEVREKVPTADDFERLNLEDKVILIAEDNLINQMILEELIAPCKATIVVAENGREALKVVRERHIDLVFMDMQMPVMDGLHATEEIRAFLSKDELPIVAVSANAMKEDREEALFRGMNHYITKPIEISQLYEALKTWLGS